MELRLSKKLFNKLYLPYLTDYSHRFEVYYGGSGSGKSVFVAQKILIKCLNEKRRVLVIRKTQASQRDSCWQLFLSLLSQWKILPYVQVSKSNFTITFPTSGSQILFKGLDDSEKIKSIADITDIWTEEATELTVEDFDQLNLRLRAKVPYLQIFVSFNPISKANWVYKRWFENPNKDASTLIIKSTYKDNKFLPQAYIEQLEQMIQKNPTYYKIYALGEFCSLDKLVYNNWTIEEFDYRDLDGELVVGLDFGFSTDPTAIVASIVRDNDIFIFKEYVATGKTNDDIARIIQALSLSKSRIVADSAEPKSITELKRLGLQRIQGALKGPDSIRSGIQRIQKYAIHVHPSCENVITEFENYSWRKDKQTGEYVNEPIDDFNHCMDAFRYSMDLVFKSNKLKLFDKSLLGL